MEQVALLLQVSSTMYTLIVVVAGALIVIIVIIGTIAGSLHIIGRIKANGINCVPCTWVCKCDYTNN